MPNPRLIPAGATTYPYELRVTTQEWLNAVNSLRQAWVDGTIITGGIPITTKGDLLTRSAIGLERIGVGTDGQVLTANSATPTGLEWASAGGGQAFYYQATAPSGANVGDEWVDSDTGIFYKFIDDGSSTQWVEV